MDFDPANKSDVSAHTDFFPRSVYRTEVAVEKCVESQKTIIFSVAALLRFGMALHAQWLTLKTHTRSCRTGTVYCRFCAGEVLPIKNNFCSRRSMHVDGDGRACTVLAHGYLKAFGGYKLFMLEYC